MKVKVLEMEERVTGFGERSWSLRRCAERGLQGELERETKSQRRPGVEKVTAWYGRRVCTCEGVVYQGLLLS